MKFAYKPSPNYRTKQTTSGIMRDLTIALLCVYAYSVIYYGLNYGSGFAIRAVLMLADSVAAAMLTEGLYFKATKQDVKKSLLSSYSWITAIILTMADALVNEDADIARCRPSKPENREKIKEYLAKTKKEGI